MTAQPLVSIIVDNYNSEQYVAQAIESALNQTYARCEVIVVDDGSTDRSPEVIERYADRAKIIIKPNGGQASAFNCGFAHARGDLIWFLDGDDELVPEAVSMAVANWAPGVSSVHGHLRVVLADGKPTRHLLPKYPLMRDDRAEFVARWGAWGIPPSSGHLYTRAALEKVLPLDETVWRLNADTPLYHSMPFLGKVRGLNAVVGSWRKHSQNASHPEPDWIFVSRLLYVHAQERALVRHWASVRGIQLPDHLPHPSLYILTCRLLYVLLGLRHPVYPQDTLRSILTSAMQVILTAPPVVASRSQRLRYLRLFLGTLWKPRAVTLRRLIRRVCGGEHTQEQIEQFLAEAERSRPSDPGTLKMQRANYRHYSSMATPDGNG